MAQEEMEVDLFGDDASAEDSPFVLPPPVMLSELISEPITAPHFSQPMAAPFQRLSDLISAQDQRSEVIALDPTPRERSPGASHTSNALQMLQGALEQLRQAAVLRSSSQQTRARRRIARRQQRGSQRTTGTRTRSGLMNFFQASHGQGPAAPADGSGDLIGGANEPGGDSSDDTVLLSDEDGESSNEVEIEEAAQPAEPAPEELHINLIPVSSEAPESTEPAAGATTEGVSSSSAEPPVLKIKEVTRTPVKPVVGALPVEEDEGDTCAICFEPWTNAGQHRLSALRCGHLFGYTCIDRWLKGGAAKCPQCNKKAKRGDIVVLYARTLKALDTSEQERMKSSLEMEQSLRRKAELESAQCRLQVQVLTDECGKLRKQIQELKMMIAQHGTSSSSQQPSSSRVGTSGSLPSSQGQHKYNFEKAILISQGGNCRVMSYCEWLGCLVVSQPSSHSTLIPGCGVKKLSAANMKSSQYIPIHSKQIRGLAFNNRSDGLLLSAALDNTVKLTSLLTNTVVQTYNTGRPVWSCCWCADDSNYVYAGLINGSVLVYDLRDTSQYVKELVPQASRCPVVSLSYVPRAASEVFPCGGVLAGTLEGACFWEMKDAQYKPHILPLEAGGCVDVQTESSTRHCLVTYRPGKSHNYMRCVMMELVSNRLADASDEYNCSCYPVQTFNAGPTCKLLTKNAIYQNPERDGSILVCAGDESSNSAMLWHSGSGSLVQKLQADQPVLDICPMEVNQTSLLATLTEKMVKIYKWE